MKLADPWWDDSLPQRIIAIKMTKILNNNNNNTPESAKDQQRQSKNVAREKKKSNNLSKTKKEEEEEKQRFEWEKEEENDRSITTISISHEATKFAFDRVLTLHFLRQFPDQSGCKFTDAQKTHTYTLTIYNDLHQHICSYPFTIFVFLLFCHGFFY